MAATVTAVAALPAQASASAQASAQASTLSSMSLPSFVSHRATNASTSTSTTFPFPATSSSSLTTTTTTTTMATPTSTSLLSSSSLSIQTRLDELRKELKTWERDFAATHGGRKAGRDDIKADCVFAAKYKEYNALRGQVAGKEKGASDGKKAIGRMKEDEESKESAGRNGEKNIKGGDGARNAALGSSSLSTPKKSNNRTIKSRKMFKVEKTKGTDKMGQEEEEDRIQEAETDENQQNLEHQFLATPSRTRAMLGPTPQKDGVVLGLFDLLSPSVGVPSMGAAGDGAGAGSIASAAMTPSKGDRSRLREITGNSTATFQVMTPRKNRYGAFGGIGVNGENVFDIADDVENDFVNRKGSRTPASAGKRFLLDSFVTPRKRRRCDGTGSADATPSSVAKRFMTPQFLRREAPVIMDTLAEDDRDCGAVAGDGLGGLDMKVGLSSRARQPWKRKGLVRSLSSMIQGLRKQEDERLDEEMDIMDEIEGGEGNILLKSKKSKINAGDKNDDTEENEARMVVAESQIESTLDADGLVSLAKDDDQTARGEGDAAVPTRKKKGQKRQTRRVILRPTKNKTKQQQQQAESQSTLTSEDEYEGHTGPNNSKSRIDEEFIEGNRDAGATRTSLIKDSTPKSKRGASKAKAEDTTSTTVKRARKVSEQAHANYRKLKIKSKLSKGGGKGRFGRRRR